MNPIFESAVALVRDHIPGFDVRYKNESWSSKVIAVLVWLFNRRYMTDFTTTRYPKVYFPSREFVEENPRRAVKILAHEFVHLWDRKTTGVWFNVGYALPQLAALLLVLIPIIVAFIQPWWVALLCAIPAIVCACPIPAYWRMIAELRGYSMNMAVNYWRYGSIQPDTMTWIVSHFTGWAYYKMWPFEDDMTGRVKERAARIRNDMFDDDGPFTIFKQFVKENEFK